MKKVFVCLAITAVVVGAFGGCGSGKQQPGKKTVVQAMDFQDGADKYFTPQLRCPVCGKQPLKKDLYVDVEDGRIYFDKKECVTKFKNNKDKFLKKFNKRIRDIQSGGGLPSGGQ